MGSDLNKPNRLKDNINGGREYFMVRIHGSFVGKKNAILL